MNDLSASLRAAIILRAVLALKMNRPLILAIREEEMIRGRFPPFSK